MAQNLVLNIRINSANGVNAIQQIGGAATTTITTINGLTRAADALTEELNRTAMGTQRYNELAQQLRVVNTEIRNTDLSLEALDNEQLVGEIRGVVGGLGDMATGLALVGVSGENVEKIAQTFAKFEGISKAATGALDVYNSGMKVVNNVIVRATAAQTALTAQTTAQGNASTFAAVKMKVLNAVMNANPAVILLTAVAALAAGIATYTIMSSRAADAEKKRAEETKKAAEASKEHSSFIAKESSTFVGLITQLGQTNKNSKERAKLIKDINSQYGTTLKNIQDETKFQAQLNLAVEDYIAYKEAQYNLQKNEKNFEYNLEKQITLKKELQGEEEKLAKIQNDQADELNKMGPRPILDPKYYDETVSRIQKMDDNIASNILSINQEIKQYSGWNKSIATVNLSLKSLTEGRYDDYKAQDKDKTKEKTKEYQDASKAIDGIVAAQKRLDAINEKIASSETKSNLDAETKAQLESINQTGEYSVESINRILDAKKKATDEAINEDRRLKLEATQNAIEIEAINKEADFAIAQSDIETKENKLAIYKTLEDAQEAYSQKEIDDAKRIAEAHKLALEQVKGYVAEFQSGLQNIAAGFEADDLDAINSAFNAVNSTIVTLTGSFQDLLKNWDALTSEEKMEQIGTAVAAVGSAVSEIATAVVNNKIEEALNESLNAITAQEEALKSSLVNRLISEEEYANATAELEQERINQERAAKAKAFKADKANAIAQAAISGSLAILQAFAQLGPIGGIIGGALIAGITAVQIGLIANKNFTAARGGVVPGNGKPSNQDSVQAMLAPGEVVMNANSSSMFLPVLSAMNEAGGGIPLVSGLSSNKPQIITVYESNKNDRPIQAYITDTQVSSALKNESKIKNRSSMFK